MADNYHHAPNVDARSRSPNIQLMQGTVKGMDFTSNGFSSIVNKAEHPGVGALLSGFLKENLGERRRYVSAP